MVLSKKQLWATFAETVALQIDSSHPGKQVFVEQSWGRSCRAGIDRKQRLFRRVDDNVLTERLHENTSWLPLAIPLLDAFSRRLQIRHVLYVTGPRGVILHSVGDPTWRAAQALMPGFDWSEAVMGTNGAGTALATNQPVAVIGPEHYLEEFSGCTCLAAPLHAPDGNVMGAVDLSTAVEHVRPEQLWDVIAVAEEIEGRYAQAPATPAAD